MSDVAIEVWHVWKKFHRGEIHDSLRDLVPALAKRLVGRGPKRSELGAEDFWALKDVSFEVRRGEALGIIGPNGAGKSTMLKILSQILRPNRGHYHVNGRLRALIEVGAGFHNDLTGRENIYLNGSILAMSRREIDRKLDEIIDFSGIKPFIDTPIKRYSSGMRARLGFSIAAHMDPDILLVDEVLSVGDASFRELCVAKMKSIAKSGAAIIFVTHDLDSLLALCPASILLREGIMVKRGPSFEVVQQYLDRSEMHRGTASELGSLTIHNLKLNGDLIQPRCSVSCPPGSEIEIHSSVTLGRPAEEFMVCLALYRADRTMPVADINLPLNPESGLRKLPITDAPLSLKLAMNLSRGVYSLGVALFHRTTHSHFARIDKLALIEVQESVSWSGPVWLNPRLGLGSNCKYSVKLGGEPNEGA